MTMARGGATLSEVRSLRSSMFIAVVAVLFIAFSPGAEAKMPPFELRVSRTTLEAGQSVVVVVQLTDPTFEAPRLQPHVEVYRTADLPTAGMGVGSARPLPTVNFVNSGAGEYRARVEISEPGSYQVVSMLAWNYQLSGYPEPIELRVVAAPLAPARRVSPTGGSSDDLAPWVLGGAVSALALGALGISHRRERT